MKTFGTGGAGNRSLKKNGDQFLKNVTYGSRVGDSNIDVKLVMNWPILFSKLRT